MSLAAMIAVPAGKEKRDPCLEAASQLLTAIHAHDAQGVAYALRAYAEAMEAEESDSEDESGEGAKGY